MCVNVAKLRGKIVERGLTQEKLALELSMDKALYPHTGGGEARRWMRKKHWTAMKIGLWRWNQKWVLCM